MGRLIDADDFKKFLQALCKAGAPYSEVIQLLDRQPTAYDVEKVVAELEKEKCTRVTYEDKYAQGWNNGIQNAIFIVRKGGVEC